MKYRRLASSRRKDIGIRKLELGLSIYSVPLHVQTHVFMFILHYCFYSYIMFASLGIRQHIHSLFVLSRNYIIYIYIPSIVYRFTVFTGGVIHFLSVSSSGLPRDPTSFPEWSVWAGSVLLVVVIVPNRS